MDSSWRVKKGDRFLVELEITEDQDLYGSDFLRLFYRSKEDYKIKGFEFTTIHFANGMDGNANSLKSKLRKAFDKHLDEMFTRPDLSGYSGLFK